MCPSWLISEHFYMCPSGMHHDKRFCLSFCLSVHGLVCLLVCPLRLFKNRWMPLYKPNGKRSSGWFERHFWYCHLICVCLSVCLSVSLFVHLSLNISHVSTAKVHICKDTVRTHRCPVGLFSRGHATLHLAVSVRRSVRWSVRPTHFWIPSGFRITAPA